MTITINYVLQVSKLKTNLLLVRHLVLKYLEVGFSDKGCFVLSLSKEEITIINDVNHRRANQALKGAEG